MLDYSRMQFSEEFLASMEARMQQAFAAMKELEAGAIANPDENRMVGHYWLRNASLAPTPEIREDIEKTVDQIEAYAKQVHSAGQFKNVLVIGIGGSALGPQFVAQALGCPKGDKMGVYFFDNTDPDGIDYTLKQLDGKLIDTLPIVISKSGGTPETRNGMLEAKAAYEAAGLNFAKHAVAITGEGSKLDKYAKDNGWLTHFPMWDWVGGRTSELATVGLVPAALQGLDIRQILAGAAAMDELTRKPITEENPAAILALMWYHATCGKGMKDMVILPYKDRLMLFSKYLQQLVMESLGKEKDLDGKVVNQGIAVYGNKGSTDQHAYVQQLRDGINNFFATFIEVLEDRDPASPVVEVEPNTTAGDYLKGFLLGTRSALSDSGRESMTITIDRVTPFSVGVLIALYERAVGLYASLININAYHQPGVEAGKKAAARYLEINLQILGGLRAEPGKRFTADALASQLNLENEIEIVFKLLMHLSANAEKGIRIEKSSSFTQAQFYAQG